MKHLNCWKKLSNRYSSDIFVKGDQSLEIFQDTSWRSDNANVIVRNKTEHTLESNLGKATLVKYFDKKKEARDFAKEYIDRHGGRCKR